MEQSQSGRGARLQRIIDYLVIANSLPITEACAEIPRQNHLSTNLSKWSPDLNSVDCILVHFNRRFQGILFFLVCWSEWGTARSTTAVTNYLSPMDWFSKEAIPWTVLSKEHLDKKINHPKMENIPATLNKLQLSVEIIMKKVN